MSVCSIAVLLACLSFILFQLSQLRPQALKKAQAIATMTAIHSYAALAFEDKNAMAETLKALNVVKEIELVRIKNLNDDLFYEYNGKEVHSNHQHDEIPKFNELIIKSPITYNNQNIGILELHYDLAPALWHLFHEVMVIFFIGIGAVGTSAIVAFHKHKQLIKPVQALTHAANQISTTGNYSLRVNTESPDDELGLLIRVFNSMLNKVQHAHDELEQRVEERTFQLNDALEHAMAASQAKSLFLANMSHEIRTPMTAILGFSDILQDSSLPEEDRIKFLQTIERNGKHLLAIINDILDLSKIEALQLQIEHIPTQPLDILHDVQSLMQVKAYEKQLKLIVLVEAPFPTSISSDPIRIRQVLVNLLSNAVKFTQQGTITLTAKYIAADNPNFSQLCFEVRDTGIGMSPQQVEKIFKPFTQADESTTRRFGGTGLGLTISQKLASLLGGEINVSSIEGQGTCFGFTIKTGPVDASSMVTSSGTLGQLLLTHESKETAGQAQNPDAIPLLKGRRILLVEDGIDNQKLIRMLLEREGVIMSLAENGQIAIDRVAQANQIDLPYDLILMDMQMPVMDGYAATRQLRRDGYTYPIVALTANAMNQDRDNCIKSGCTDYMTKPINRQKLLEIVAKYVGDIPATDELAA
jgi:signal transduction histidine kinase/CheY-like chemotaxis protein